jgi:hypothetical protein
VTLDEFLARARDEPRIVGVVVTGSRGRDALVHEGSDWDLRVLVVDGEEELAAALATPHGSPVEITATTLSGFVRLPEWDRYSYAHARVVVDKLSGGVAELVEERGRLSQKEADARARASLDAYVNSLDRSLQSARLGLDLESRLDAAESVSHLLDTLFALEGRVRPYNKYLAWELETHPLADWSASELRAALPRVLDGDVVAQHLLFREVELRARRRGLGDVVDAWGADVAGFRGT